MLASSVPPSLALPFAASAGANYIRTIPVASQIGITAGAASYTDGFPPLNFLPVAAGGVPPFGQDMNGVLFTISGGLQWLQVGGRPTYNSAFSSTIGGYPNGAILQSADGTGFWRSLVDNNVTNPDTGGANWVPAQASYGVTNITAGGSSITLTAVQYAKGIIVIGGTLSGNIQLVFPNFVGQWLIVNGASGAYSITAKTASGTGAVLASGTQAIWGDGTNIYTGAGGAGASTATATVGGARNLQGTFYTATTAAWVADELICKTALGGTPYVVASYSQAINLATVGAGGMDVGSAPASTWIYVYAVFNSVSNAQSIVATTSGSGASIYPGTHMPAGYNASCLIGTVYLNASANFTYFVQRDNVVSIAIATAVTSGYSASFASVSLSTVIPPNAKSVAGYLQSTVNTNSYIYLANNSSGTGTKLYGGAGMTVLDVEWHLTIATAQTIWYENSQVSTTVNLYVNEYSI